MATAQKSAPITSVRDWGIAAEGVATLAGPALERLDAAMGAAIGGSWEAVGSYVAAYRDLTRRLFDGIVAERPELEDAVAPAGIEVIERAALDAPFSPWVAIAGPGAGIGLGVLARFRELIVQLDPLPLPSDPPAAPLVDLEPQDVRRFMRLVMQELDRDLPPLRRATEVFALSATELGRLFGVSRQAAAQWLDQGPPPARQAKAATVAAIADVFDLRLKRSRIPGVVRRPAEAYGGRTALELIEADRHEWLLASARASFDYAATA